MAVRLSDADAIKVENGKNLIDWLQQFKFFSPKKVEVITNSDEVYRIKIYTDNHCYSISATNTYLGCGASTRKPRPGEDWTRGNDLPDGKFDKGTFQRILGAIVFYEAKDIIRTVDPIADENREAIKTVE